ncbi:M23 family metallopeptidase [Chitinilyticum piscinae]|uniref:M23 family metallopeptidase n=1 Tax=Chitinilyticum piscinae TaxID=2866724 RepID=A0A8J7FKT5_9NEIS|nr:M23 family metallopeptidase [Chitinilyticum piscinae]MBE9607981.1 M23 family metallopeptidase [Chitinilyticum piscinae]
MNVIVVSDRLAKAVSMTGWQLALCSVPLVLVLVLAGYWAGRVGVAVPGASPRSMTPVERAQLDALAMQVGELQARLLRMDQLAVEVGKRTGLDIKPFVASGVAARGGVFRQSALPGLDELASALQQSDLQAQGALDALNVAHTLLLQPSASRLPVHAPIATGMQTSSFGWRSDPFRGTQAFHEGLDFSAPTGTPIQAAADGLVRFAGWHPQYGNMIDLDHGNGVTSRYAHASELLVAEGAQIKVGQEIARVGSTGRSTGPHLHFEIRFMGVAQNPLRFVAPEVLASTNPGG